MPLENQSRTLPPNYQSRKILLFNKIRKIERRGKGRRGGEGKERKGRERKRKGKGKDKEVAYLPKE